MISTSVCPRDKPGLSLERTGSPLCKIRKKPQFVPGTDRDCPCSLDNTKSSQAQPDQKVYVHVYFSCLSDRSGFHFTSLAPLMTSLHATSQKQQTRRMARCLNLQVWLPKAEQPHVSHNLLLCGQGWVYDLGELGSHILRDNPEPGQLKALDRQLINLKRPTRGTDSSTRGTDGPAKGTEPT